MSRYYQNKIDTLKDIFGAADVSLHPEYLRVNQRVYPIRDDVIILLAAHQYTPFVSQTLQTRTAQSAPDSNFAAAIQTSFGAEWTNYGQILREHAQEFAQYFDLVDVPRLSGLRVCDLGCGNGRWSYFLSPLCREIILVDFSDAIFVARKNLREAANCVFFMGDLKTLPFKPDFADFLFCLGVLHHLPTSALEAVRQLKPFAPELLIFLYYAFDNRPVYFQFLLKIITLVRLQLCRIRQPLSRKVLTLSGTYLLYLPLIALGHLLRPFRLSSYVPLYDFYHDKSVPRIQQDVYDRFFTSIEQRFSKHDILELQQAFAEVRISDRLPYWHFLCKR